MLRSAPVPLGRGFSMPLDAATSPLAFLYPMDYTIPVIEIRQTAQYSQWFDQLRDDRARARIDARVRRLQLGNAGDVKPVGEGVSEMRIDYGPGYRVYYVNQGPKAAALLNGGTKSTQGKDIKSAKDLAKALGDDNGKSKAKRKS